VVVGATVVLVVAGVVDVGVVTGAVVVADVDVVVVGDGAVVVLVVVVELLFRVVVVGGSEPGQQRPSFFVWRKTEVPMMRPSRLFPCPEITFPLMLHASTA
jgi:hypothetical protein